MSDADLTTDGVIDYDVVFRDYLRSLVDTLRGFSAGLAGLELWVPHEDERISLRNLLDVAAAAGWPRLAVRFGPAHRGRVDAAGLRAVAAAYGDVQIQETHEALLITVEELRPTQLAPAPASTSPSPAARRRNQPAPVPATPGAITTAYDGALAQTARDLRHELRDGGPQKINQPPATIVEVCGEFEAARLLLAIDRTEPRPHVIINAVWSLPAAAPASTRALLDRLCDIALGLPILELAHHGVIRLEAALRDPNAPRPVAGIVLPATAHPMFRLPTALVRGALANYRAKTGYDESVGRYDARPGPAWLAASLSQRLALVSAAIAEPLRRLSLSDEDVHPIAVEHDVRVVLCLPASLSSQQRQRLLLDLEAHIHRAVDPRLELYAEERKDRNKLRRLAVVQDTSPNPESPAAHPAQEAS